MRKFVSGLLAATASLALASCGPSGSSGPSGSGDNSSTQADPSPVRVLTTLYPTTYFAQRIVDGLADGEARVVCPVPVDADPIFWQPTAEDIGLYQEADLIVLNGAGYERWIANAAIPTSRVVDSAAGFASAFIMIQSKTHSHGPEGKHTHEGLDGHTWLDPINAMEQSRAIHDALVPLLPEHTEALRANLDSLLDDLRGLDARLTEFTEKNRGTRLVASHPAYNYLARRYQWDLVSLDLDPSVPLAEEQIEEIRGAGLPTSGHPSVMLWESEPIAANRTRIESEFGTPMIVFSPVEVLSPEQLASGEDYLSIMHANIDRLEAALAP